MSYFFTFIIFSGLLIGAILAKQSSPKWPAKMMLICSIIILISYLIFALAVDSIDYTNYMILVIFGLLMICGIIIYLIGLLFYCLKTYAATKANEQLDYLNFQLKDQLEIRSADSSQKE